MIRVLLADDQALIRSGVRALLEAEDDIVVVGEVADGAAAVAQTVATRPDIVLMDVQMPGTDGIEATRQIVGHPHLDGVHVVMLTSYGVDQHVFAALRAGASGFIVKDTDPADLIQALRVTMRGDALLSPAVTRRLIAEFVARPPELGSKGSLARLTNREREVVAMVAQGLANDEIAERIVVSTATVKTHVGRAMTKLQARDRAQLNKNAYQSGLVGGGA